MMNRPAVRLMGGTTSHDKIVRFIAPLAAVWLLLDGD
jgi:hypothetical protein